MGSCCSVTTVISACAMAVLLAPYGLRRRQYSEMGSGFHRVQETGWLSAGNFRNNEGRFAFGIIGILRCGPSGEWEQFMRMLRGMLMGMEAVFVVGAMVRNAR